MAGAESIVNIDVTEARQRAPESINISLRAFDFLAVDDALAFFSHMEAQVLEEHHLTVLGFAACLLDIRADAVVKEVNLPLEEIFEGWNDG